MVVPLANSQINKEAHNQIMYNSRTKSTLCPLRCPKTSRFPLLPFSGCSWKKYVVFYFHVLAVGSFSSLISFRGSQFVPHTRPPFTTLRSVHFTHLSTTRHKWFLHSTPQIHAVIPFRLTAVIHTQIYPHTNSQ